MSRRGSQTRKAILDQALEVAGTLGVESITLGALASDLGMSKSGLFAHFKSKEQLQLEVLEEAVGRFVAHVVIPALKQPRGEPRVRALFERWLDWSRIQPGGCVIYNASSELDDRPGPLRDYLQSAHQEWAGTIRRAVAIAIEEGHFAVDLDAEQFVFELSALALGFHHAAKLRGDPQADARALHAFDHLIERSRALAEDELAPNRA
ncbi:MAG: TetR/AcrR family transcriptional regulator [Polyangiaceae bacterium]